MGIGWLWFYTHSDNPESLARENERRAFAVYARWRAVTLWMGNIYPRICASYREHLARRSLLLLSDHLLKDIGMFRTGSDVQIEEVHRLELSKSISTTSVNRK